MNTKIIVFSLIGGISLMLFTSGCLTPRTQISQDNRPAINMSKEQAVATVQGNLRTALYGNYKFIEESGVTSLYINHTKVVPGGKVPPNIYLTGHGDPKTFNKYCVAYADSDGIAFGNIPFHVEGLSVHVEGLTKVSKILGHYDLTHNAKLKYSDITKIGLETHLLYSYDCVLLYSNNGYMGFEYCNEQTKDQLISAYLTLCPNAFTDSSGNLPVKH